MLEEVKKALETLKLYQKHLTPGARRRIENIAFKVKNSLTITGREQDYVRSVAGLMAHPDRQKLMRRNIPSKKLSERHNMSKLWS